MCVMLEIDRRERSGYNEKAANYTQNVLTDMMTTRTTFETLAVIQINDMPTRSYEQ